MVDLITLSTAYHSWECHTFHHMPKPNPASVVHNSGWAMDGQAGVSKKHFSLEPCWMTTRWIPMYLHSHESCCQPPQTVECWLHTELICINIEAKWFRDPLVPKGPNPDLTLWKLAECLRPELIFSSLGEEMGNDTDFHLGLKVFWLTNYYKFTIQRSISDTGSMMCVQS